MELFSMIYDYETRSNIVFFDLIKILNFANITVRYIYFHPDLFFTDCTYWVKDWQTDLYTYFTMFHNSDQ